MSVKPPESPQLTFEPLDVPLQGWNLIEASAGTGKTYALAGLYLRLLIEKGLSTGEILVVTFTKAATDELKSRIRARIKDALRALAHGSDGDPFLAGLLSRTVNHERARRLLMDALRSFDESAIFTIHGFCLRALHAHAFESGCLFDTELVEDETDMIKEVIHDFWRIQFYQGSAQLFSCIRKYVDPKELLDLARLCVRDPFVRVLRGACTAGNAALQGLERDCSELFADAAISWGTSRQDIYHILANDPGLSRSIYTQKAVDRVVRELDSYFSSGYFLPVPDTLNYFCFDPPVRAGAVKKQASPPAHPFFKQCELLRSRLEEATVGCELEVAELRKELIGFVRRESSKRKLAKNVRAFSDLLLDLHGALEGEGGGELAAEIRKQYKAALIDEFQDTDPLQYAIFKRIYGHEGSAVFLIGDPKQAIFGFRGADLFSYIRASGDVAERFTLDRNWRSSEPLIRAVNSLFGRCEAPFLLEPVRYVPVKESEVASAELTIKGSVDASPLKVWFLNRQDGKPLTRGAARQMLYRAVCAEIGRILEAGRRNEMHLGGRAVGAGDMAVIVRTNREAQGMQAALRRVNIPAVIYTGESVFTSEEARELERIVQAVSDPSDDGRLRTALATKMLGVTGDELAALMENEPLWDQWLTRFEEYRLLWSHAGFISMARTLLAREHVKRLLGSFPDGERRVTNLLHVLELLHRASTEEKLGMEGLLGWLAERRQSVGDVPPDEHQMRLETDELAVKIVTVHKSKGLEYPIVFCPFLWGDSKSEQPVFAYHPTEEEYCSVVDVSVNPEEAAMECARTEQLAENIRLTYVALTRAKNRCYMAWGCIKDSETSALAYLLHGEASGGCNLSELGNHVKESPDQDLLAEIETIAQGSQGAIEIAPAPEEEVSSGPTSQQQPEFLTARRFTAGIELDWRVSSFSAITSGKEEAADVPDRDEGRTGEALPWEEAERVPEAEETSIFSFPAGATAGNCLHAIFERLDFACFESDNTRALVSAMLNRYGFAPDWTDTVCLMVKDVLTAPLEKESSLTLSTLAPSHRIHELEFHLPLSLITPDALGTLFTSRAGRSTGSTGSLIRRLGFKPVKGILKGYIDLVFQHDRKYYLVDWKSNYLGPKAVDYGAERLEQVMAQELYTLQYHIYTLALHRFLELRIPDYSYTTHFGGVYYLFLRGIRPGCSEGIFFHRPSLDFIDSLGEYVSGGQAS